ncbi:MAG TPA: SPFH domain-containing protein [Kineosporiaceae bacterium]|nr:SPFH domain-containing protein [Kineosporiaceae bacterium]
MSDVRATPAQSSRPALTTDLTEHPAWAASGWYAVGGILLAGAGMGLTIWQISLHNPQGAAAFWTVCLLVALGLVIALLGATLCMVAPLETRVVQFFGRYAGTVRRTGLVMTAPLTTRRTINARVNNFETRLLKVNDADGNPVELGAIVVWQVHDTARCVFAVQDYVNFVQVQAEAALRHVAVSHPYDDTTGSGTSLRGSTDVVAGELAREMSERVAAAGVEVVEVRISHLAYAPEIAQAMLQRQQASAIIAARSRIVDGAVGMVEMALARLQEHDIVDLDEERKAQMVSNLLVVLCGDSRATPVVNTGTLYQ